MGLIEKHVSELNLRRHMWAAGAVMKALAERLSENAEMYELTGLLHDLDYAETVADPGRHALVTAELLAGTDVPAEVIHAIKAHNDKAPVESRMDIAMYATDPVTGFLVACALIRPEKKLAAVDVPFALKRWKEKRFAAGANREAMARCEGLGLSREEFLGIALKAMQDISGELGL
jgi:putative nucleotidyltransferase with HDIG domain